MFSGTNLPRVGSYNVNVVLNAVQASEGISRVEIARQTGLTAQTVSVIVRRLIQQGIIEESGSLPSKGGKPRTTLRINPTAAYAVGIHFDPLGVSMVVVDMTGQELAHSRQEISPGLDPETLIGHAAEVALSLLADLGIPRHRVLGVGRGLSRAYRPEPGASHIASPARPLDKGAHKAPPRAAHGF